MNNLNNKDYFMVRVQSIKFTQPLTAENQPAVLIKKLADCLDKVELLEHFKFYRRSIGPMINLKKFNLANILKQFDQLTVKDLAKTRYLCLYTDLVIENYTAEAQITMQISSSTVNFSLLFTKKFIKGSGFSIEKLIEFFTSLYDTFSDIAVFGYDMGLKSFNREYPRPKPPRLHHRFNSGSMIEAYSKKFYEWDKHSTPEQLQKLSEYPLPDGIKNWWYKDDLWFIQWVDDWFDDEHVAQRLTLQEKWINSASEAPIETGYNELGDHRELSQERMTPADDLDCLGMWSIAYKISAVDDRGKADAAVIDLLQKYLTQGATPSGKTVEKAYVLVSGRQQALAIYDQVIAAGLHGVYYLADDGYYYDPFPDGLWDAGV